MLGHFQNFFCCKCHTQLRHRPNRKHQISFDWKWIFVSLVNWIPKIRLGYWSKSFLASSIPQLKFYSCSVFDLYQSRKKVNANSRIRNLDPSNPIFPKFQKKSFKNNSKSSKDVNLSLVIIRREVKRSHKITSANFPSVKYLSNELLPTVLSPIKMIRNW